MNHLDMFTREKANKIHLDELRLEARNRRLAREARPDIDMENIAFNRRRYTVLAFCTVIAAIAALLIASNMGLFPIT